MDIKSLKDLEQLIKLCRKTGIDAFEIGSIKFNLGQEPKSKPKGKQRSVADDFPEASLKVPQFVPTVSNEIQGVIKTDELTPDQLLFYSATDETQDQAQGE